VSRLAQSPRSSVIRRLQGVGINRVIARGLRPAVAEALLLGITKASLSTESFISETCPAQTALANEHVVCAVG
jgi:hypothetical protein